MSLRTFHFRADQRDEEIKVARLRAALDLTDADWAYLVAILDYEIECNESPAAKIILSKLKPGTKP